MGYLLIRNIYLSPNIYLWQYVSGMRLDWQFYRIAVMWLWFKWQCPLRHCLLVFFHRRMPCKHKSDTWYWGTWICENLIINTLKEVRFSLHCCFSLKFPRHINISSDAYSYQLAHENYLPCRLELWQCFSKVWSSQL